MRTLASCMPVRLATVRYVTVNLVCRVSGKYGTYRTLNKLRFRFREFRTNRGTYVVNFQSDH